MDAPLYSVKAHKSIVNNIDGCGGLRIGAGSCQCVCGGGGRGGLLILPCLCECECAMRMCHAPSPTAGGGVRAGCQVAGPRSW